MSWADQLTLVQVAAVAALNAAGRDVPPDTRFYVGPGRIPVDGEQLTVSIPDDIPLDPQQCGAVTIHAQVELWRKFDEDLIQQGQLSPQPSPGQAAILAFGVSTLADMQALAQIVPPSSVRPTSVGTLADQGGFVAAVWKFDLSTGVAA